MLKEGLQGEAAPNRPGHTSLGGRGSLPRRWSLLEERLRGGVAVRNGLGTPAWGDVDSSPGGGRC